MDIPILLIIFRRPDKTKQLIEALGKIKPKQIFIVADGPRSQVLDDEVLCSEARRIATEIPWPCNIKTKFATINKGPDKTIPEGIDWFFSQVEAGIILEDDCIPDPSFFTFCAELLERYKDDTRIMHISGNNFQNGVKHGDGSYYFSHYSHSWGWATWRRAWQQYHTAVANFPEYDHKGRINELPFSRTTKKFWLKLLRNTSIWDSRWLYTTWYARGLSILPNQNLVSNIGFGTDATHTIEFTAEANVATIPLETIIHPSSFNVSTAADNFTFYQMFYVPLIKRIKNKISAIINKKL